MATQVKVPTKVTFAPLEKAAAEPGSGHFYSVKKEISELNQRSSKGPHTEGAQALKY